MRRWLGRNHYDSENDHGEYVVTEEIGRLMVKRGREAERGLMQRLTVLSLYLLFNATL